MKYSFVAAPTTANEHVSADHQLRHKFSDHKKKKKHYLKISLTLSLWEQFQKASVQSSEVIEFACLACGVHRITSPASDKPNRAVSRSPEG